jgi:(p)ppGpp synthase/HD superfamily hydrolase
LEEINGHKNIDYTKVRRPKFEVVSFEKDSTPLIQFDFHFNTSYEKLVEIFPEALVDSKIRNIWIYLENPYEIDVCLVANESSESDWSEFFEGSRIFSKQN